LTLIDRVCRQQKLREALQARSVPSSDRHSSLPKRLAHFEIERELGRGGAGIVVLATDTRLRRKVALKVPHPQFLVTDDLRRRFVREAEATARLNHPHIVRVYEAGNDGPLTYLASEYCEGKTLADWLATQTEPVSPKLAVSIVRDLAEAVQHAHTKAVIHQGGFNVPSRQAL
jgi:serine/threonine protein kinase